ncbi:MAG TPA: SDR family NAD(P)-dependent oxidoreductase, partial [Ilumatobacteraceae bacterium]
MSVWNPDPGLLAGQVALVAGGAGGIGDATTRSLAACGAAVVIADRELAVAQLLAKEIVTAGGRAEAIEVDLMDEAACAAMVEQAVSAMGGIDILVNVAGGLKKHAPWGHVRDWTTDAWDAIFDLNLRYVFWTCRAAIPVLEARGGGAIVNIASLNGVVGNPNQSAYGAAKAGLINLTQTMAGECGPLGIRVNAVGPGVTMTPAASNTIADEVKNRLRAVTPLGRLGSPADIASAVVFFASP